VAPKAPKIIIGITSNIENPSWEAKNPAVGNTAKVGIGGTMVSSSAAKNTPSYKWPARNSPIQRTKESKGSNKISMMIPTKLLYKMKFVIGSNQVFLDNTKNIH